ncbi:hypothetical protein [Bradyrhizobium australafricanum]|uniref:hypothetical protein n=1 Tax=Bradyrhizobium australafricanum TaxID=2821406 RepID=UPI001CE2734F|nr:hypothetical protein [Bradyrhizobium australafricanum]MCA6100666.1 hypothetical protein [Bradyrhizobium australafricanum]
MPNASSHTDADIGLTARGRHQGHRRDEGVDFVTSDLFDSIARTCDLLVSKLPYAPDTAAKASDNFWSGGIDGTELLRRGRRGSSHELDADGTACINSLFPNPPERKSGIILMLGLEAISPSGDVLDNTWHVPGYQDLLSEQPF